ncbi:O-antigen ligase family protein [Microbulbifer sp. OS29]|uniref:O-antigen ligase family protein n=1 Tax=Microbulbifer okhotskensis TaxID=2926617 RepID=A0A9X2EPT3_9GAMM|nr:O-antigen ligase family protein [Microbulbifer okhotskensis]MCO1333366.1 O-antigen ligase family protein [Microbulbifer okhotskensis]
MSELGSTSNLTPGPAYRQQNSRWISGLLKWAYFGLFLLICGFYFFPKESGVQTGFYLTLLPATIFLLAWRRDYRFLASWQFAAFCSLPLVLALSAFWASADTADVFRSADYYWKLVLYLALFYCAIFFLLEHYGDSILHQLLLAAIVIGLLSGIASLIVYVSDGGLQRLHRIGGISLEGNIDKTGMLFGFHALFCCYGLSQKPALWRWASGAGLLTSCLYIVLSQTKIPILMAAFSILLVVFSSRSRRLKTIILIAMGALPMAYLALFDDLPFLHRGSAYSIRLHLWQKVYEEFLQSPLIGQGLVHKKFIELDIMLPHPHNYLLDIARFSGLLGVAACAWQGLAVLWSIKSKEKILSWIPGLYAAWFLFGVLAMLAYSQQPLVKPNYIWFFYWIPLAILLARNSLENQDLKPYKTFLESNPQNSNRSGTESH